MFFEKGKDLNPNLPVRQGLIEEESLLIGLQFHTFSFQFKSVVRIK